MKLIYSALASLDGYIADERGDFSWAFPPEDVHAHVNDAMRSIGTHLYGRRMYEVMRYWQTADQQPDASAVTRDFAAVWQAADKVVYSTTLGAVETAHTRLVTTFDADDVRERKARALQDLSIGGAAIAARAFADALIDEVSLYLFPTIVGGGKRALPADVRVALELVEERRFSGAVVLLRYAVRG